MLYVPQPFRRAARRVCDAAHPDHPELAVRRMPGRDRSSYSFINEPFLMRALKLGSPSENPAW